MAAVNFVEVSQADGPVRQILEAVQQQYGFAPNILKALAQCPDLLATFVPFWAAVYKSPTIGGRLRAIAALATARAHNCEYCIAHMSASGLKAGMTLSEVLCVTPGGMADPREAAVVDFADALTRDSAGVDDALLGRMRHHFSEPELVNLAMVVGLYALTGRFLKALRIDLDEELSAMAPQPDGVLAEHEMAARLFGLGLVR